MPQSSLNYKLLIKPHKQKTFVCLVFAVLLTCLQAPLPYLSGYIVDSVLPHGNTQLLLKTVTVMAALYFCFVVVSYVYDRYVLRIKQSMFVDLHMQAIKGIVSMPFRKRFELNNGDLVSRLTRDTEQLECIMPYGWSGLVHQCLLSLSLLTVVFILNWQLTLLLLLLIPMGVFLYYRFDSKLWSSSVDETNSSGEKLLAIQETIESDAELRAYGAENYFLALTGKRVKDFESKRFIRQLYDIKVNACIIGLPMIGIVLVWFLGGRMVISGDITLGLIITYTSTLALMVPAVIGIIEFVSSLPNESTALRRIHSLSEYDGRTDKAGLQNYAAINNVSLDVSNMSFAYSPLSPMFISLNAQFKPGNAYLIKGGNGTGKSTLLRILSGDLQPDSGSVTVNKVDISSMAGRSDWITYVPQALHMVSDTIRNNITFGAEYPRNAIMSVLQKVQAVAWVKSLPGGLDYQISNAQSEFSGGQIQKIGIARALLRDTPILLLDEPTNNLDSAAVEALVVNLQEHKKDKVVIVVSHDDRIMDAIDQVLYLDKARADEPIHISVQYSSVSSNPEPVMTSTVH